jgi:very-short-patch-repair endonuclease
MLARIYWYHELGDMMDIEIKGKRLVSERALRKEQYYLNRKRVKNAFPRLDQLSFDECLKRSKELNKKKYPSEMKFIKFLKSTDHFRGVTFVRNYPLLNKFFGDFVCIEKGWVIEIDGNSHEKTNYYDHQRDKMLRRSGWKVLRLKVEAFEIWGELAKRFIDPSPMPPNPESKRQKRKRKLRARFYPPKKQVSSFEVKKPKIILRKSKQNAIQAPLES